MNDKLERYGLETARIREIAGDPGLDGDRGAYFAAQARLLVLADDERAFLAHDAAEADLDVLRAHNRALYADVLPEHYPESWCCPSFACAAFGREEGQLLSALAYELRSVIGYTYDGALERVMIRMELFLEVYSLYAAAAAGGQVPGMRSVRECLYQYVADYAEEEETWRIETALTGSRRPLAETLSALEGTDLSDVRFLYRSGEYVTENEERLALHMAGLPEETVAKMADTMVEGYRRGFELGGKDLSRKKTCSLYTCAGLERMAVRAMRGLEALGLTVCVPRDIPTLFSLSGSRKSGYAGADASKQMLFDHREDLALLIDEDLITRKTDSLRNAYRRLRAETVLYAGPAVTEVFGEAPFLPERSPDAPRFTPAQQKLVSRYRIKASILYDEAVIGRERSFTIISFPVPAISKEHFGEIFDEVVRINTLDYDEYQAIQARLIEALDRADHVRIVGREGNRTDLTVALWDLRDPAAETLFENCVADVNIPVGEVFTSPRLTGTNGVLHVSQVHLEGLRFEDLSLTFRDGRVAGYSCGGFDDPAAGRAYVEENVLFHHEQLPMGEFAIGTNTTAFAAARRWHIEDRLPILIAEKTGPHFAVGDTCYSEEEDNVTYNPDGKRIVARENEVSAQRRSAPEKAYFGCHTDITIPYEEIGRITAVAADGTETDILRDGRFVLAGTEALNGPLDALEAEKTGRKGGK